jgi:hypothetical protein
MERMTRVDATARLLTGAIVRVYAASLNGTSLWLISNARGATAALLVLRILSGATCRCGHGRDAHAHYREGSDCALCGCRRWRRKWLTGKREGR